MADLFQELMDDARADRATDLWNRYGKWVIYVAVSIVIVTAVLVFWRHHQRENAMAQTALYFEASDMLAKGEASAAIATFDKISVPEKSTYYGLVLLKKAEALSQLGKDKEARDTLSTLAKRNDVYGDIGKMMLGSTQSDDKATALRFSRMEWSAWELANKGDTAKAAEQFSALAIMDDAPQTLRERAGMMATYLKNKPKAADNE